MSTEKLVPVESSHLCQQTDILVEGRVPASKKEVSPSTETSFADIPNTQVKAQKRLPHRKFSIAYKLKVLEDYDACDNALARGALMRREGLYSSSLSTWRKQRDKGILTAKTRKKMTSSMLKNQKLIKENDQLKKKLAQAEAIIELQKKVSDLLGMHILPLEHSEGN